MSSTTLKDERCFFCNAELLNDNVTKEHIIPNSIGGKKKVSNFICRKCNSEFGETWDAELGRQLNPLALLLGVKRERGDAPPQVFSTSQGEQIKITHGYELEPPHPTVKERELEEGKVELNISARSHKELRQILKGLERKYPGISKQVDVDSLSYNEGYSDGLIHIPLGVGGVAFGKSIAKSCLALAYNEKIFNTYHNIRRCFDSDIVPDNTWNHCFRNFISNRESYDIFHCVHIEASAKLGVIVGYVEYFSAYKFIVLLSDNYSGIDGFATYGINLITGEEVDIDIEINLEKQDIIEIINDKPNYDEMKKSIGKVVNFFQSRSWKKEQHRVLDKAVRYAFENAGLQDGDVIKPEHISKLSNATVERMIPFLLHMFRGMTS